MNPQLFILNESTYIQANSFKKMPSLSEFSSAAQQLAAKVLDAKAPSAHELEQSGPLRSRATATDCHAHEPLLARQLDVLVEGCTCARAPRSS